MFIGRIGAYSSKSCFTINHTDSIPLEFNTDGVMDGLKTFKEVVIALCETDNDLQVNIPDVMPDCVTYNKYAPQTHAKSP
jgi:hypothetical protein